MYPATLLIATLMKVGSLLYCIVIVYTKCIQLRCSLQHWYITDTGRFTILLYSNCIYTQCIYYLTTLLLATLTDTDLLMIIVV